MARIRQDIRVLQMCDNLDIDKTIRTFQSLNSTLENPNDVDILLGYLRPSLGGAFPIVPCKKYFFI